MTIDMAEDVFPPSQRERRTDRSRDARSPHATEAGSSSVDQVLDDSFPASDPPSWTGAITRIAASSTRFPR